MQGATCCAYYLLMHDARVLVACELKSYRQAIAAALRTLRPNVKVFETEEENLDGEVGRLAPEMVVCSQLTAVIEDRVPVWVELYPGYGAESVIGVGGERSTIGEIQLSDLLAVIDRAERLAQEG